MSTEIQAGDLVVLKSGGPTMTAGKIAYKTQDLIAMVENPIVESVECHWFQDNSPCFTDEGKHWGDLNIQEFPPAVLRKV